MNYLRNLWAAICGQSSARLAELEARVAEFEKDAAARFESRSAASRRAHETRKASKQQQEPQQ